MRVKFFHKRHKTNGVVDVKGGTTYAYHIDNNFVVQQFAVAHCHTNDTFCKHTGRVKAAGRLNSPRLRVNLKSPMFEKDFINFLVS